MAINQGATLQVYDSEGANKGKMPKAIAKGENNLINRKLFFYN